jgi:hypothetical protein
MRGRQLRPRAALTRRRKWPLFWKKAAQKLILSCVWGVESSKVQIDKVFGYFLFTTIAFSFCLPE